MITIYKIVSPNNRIYVGKTINLTKRIRQYRVYHKQITQPKLQYSINKYGWDAHTLETLEVCEEGIANEREIFWIKELKSYHFYNERGLNLTPGGDGGKGSRKRGCAAPIEQRDADTYELARIWYGGVPEAAAALKIKTSSLYGAIKQKKQIHCKGYLWCLEGKFKKPRRNKRFSKPTMKKRAATYKKRYEAGLFKNGMEGKIGQLSPSGISVYCPELDMTFESMLQGAIYFKENIYQNKKIKTLQEMIRSTANGAKKIKKEYSFTYLKKETK